jgi:phosphoserine phosphatase RsbU/P
MSATLRLLSGPEAGRLYEFGEREIVIGRDKKTCFVVLERPEISRDHARIYFQGDNYWLKHIGRNNTTLNGMDLEKNAPAALADGARIEICDWLMEFRSDLPLADHADADNASSVSSSLDARLGVEELTRINAADKLRLILRISEALGRTLDTQALLTNMIDGLLEIFPRADHALVLLADGERLVTQVDRDRHNSQRRCKYSTTIVRQAMTTRRAILSNDLSLDQPVPITGSIASSRIRSIICVPLLSQKLDPLGVIELDAYDHNARFTADDLDLLNCVARQVSLSLEYSQLHRRLVQQERLQKELEVAGVIQHAFLPESMPAVSGYGFWAYYKATGMVGGDYYDFVRLPHGRQAVVLGDVAGKGIPAALMMARLSAICRSALLGCAHDLGLAMALINREVCAVTGDDGFATLALCVIDPVRHEVTVSSAGHMSPILRRSDGTLDEPADDAVRGCMLGFDEHSEYKTATLAIGPGECAVLFSDGFMDAVDAGQRPYSIQRIRAGITGMATTDPAAVGEALLEDVSRHSAGQPQCDDMAMVVFGRLKS